MLGNHDLKSGTQGCMKITGSFRPNGSSSISSTYNKGQYFTVSRSAQGKFLVTLTQPIMEFISINATLQLSSAAGRTLQIGDSAVSSQVGTFYIRNVDSSGTEQDIASDANNKIHFEVYVKIGTC